MKTFTFFLRDESIHELSAPDKDSAMRLLCAKLGRSWAHLHPDILEVLEGRSLDSANLPIGVHTVRHPEREKPFLLSVVEVCGLQAVHACEIGQKPASRAQHWLKKDHIRNWLDQLILVNQ